MSAEIENETVYVNTNEESHVMSDKVQTLAGSIYKEFERVIKKYDEDVVKDLMPLVVGILEALDAAFAEKQELDVELELFREDNEQLLTQYEREKQLRKGAEQKYLELEDNIEGIKKELEEKVEILESIIRMSEIKSKNTADHVSRLEEKEQEAKNEYNKLHERYTELFRTHMEYMERTKILLGTDKLSDFTATSPRITKGTFNLRPVSIAHGNIIELHNHEGLPITYESGAHYTVNNIGLRSELEAHSADQSDLSGDNEQLTDSINVTERATASRLNQTLAEIIASTPELGESHDLLRSQETLEHHSSLHNDSSVFEEIQATDIAEVDFSTGISDSDKEDEEEDEETKENDRDSVGDNFYGMCRELENLILENTELLATKNALNIVKDDLIAKIDMLTSEQDVLREEIVILNSVRRKLQDRISQMEEEMRKLKEELENRNKEPPEKEEKEDDVPMAQRKRFTRVEMARVLMERNQYKERLMELQEAVRWTEMMRASKEHPGELQAKKKSGVWNFFSELVSLSQPIPDSPVLTQNQMPARHHRVLHFGHLFSSSNKSKQNLSVASVKQSSPTTNNQPSGDMLKKHRSSIPRSSSCDFLQEDLTSEKAKKEREKERREQYKQVRALVKKDDGRMQAYGWSLPAKFTTSIKETSEKFQVPVPVPVYCRPLFDNQTGWKIWCAAGVNLSGGKTRIGHSVADVSVFCSGPPLQDKKENLEGDSLDRELKDSEANIKGTDTELMSSLVWVCTSKQESSQVSVINANNPTDILDTFSIPATHILYIASVPGVLESDYPVAEEILKAEIPDISKRTVVTTGSSPGSEGESTGVGGITFIQCAAGEAGPLTRSLDSLSDTKYDGSLKMEEDSSVKDKKSNRDITEEEVEIGEDPLRTELSEVSSQPQTLHDVLSASQGHTTSAHTAGIEDSGGSATDGRSSSLGENEHPVEMKKMSSVLPTMWMGAQSGSIYIHSSVTNWKKCLHSVRLRDSILGIVHVKGRVLVSLANGTIAVFHRAADGQWDLMNYHIIDLGQPRQSIRCMTVVSGKLVWCGYKNKIHIICPHSMAIEKSFDAHPRKESQVRHLCWVGDGVWVSIRLDSTLRLYHAHTHQHLQDVDVEPYVSKMLGTGKLGFSFVRITAMLVSCNRLWIGTSNGVIISVPLSESNKQPMIATSSSLDGPSGSWPGGIVRVYSDAKLDSAVSGSFIPYCSMSQAQLSFHGYKDAVKFFVCVPEIILPENCKYISPLGRRKCIQRQNMSPDPDLTSCTLPRNLEAVPAPPTNSRLIVSGGEGYIDFRLGDGDDGELTSSAVTVEDDAGDGDNELTTKATVTTKLDSSHIIIWQVISQE